jgi:hypothetical protein
VYSQGWTGLFHFVSFLWNLSQPTALWSIPRRYSWPVLLFYTQLALFPCNGWSWWFNVALFFYSWRHSIWQRFPESDNVWFHSRGFRIFPLYG